MHINELLQNLKRYEEKQKEVTEKEIIRKRKRDELNEIENSLRTLENETKKIKYNII